MVLWLLCASIFLIIELSSPGLFFFLSLSIGSCAAALADYMFLNFNMQMFLFLVLSCSSIIFLSLLVKAFNKKRPLYYSNIYALRGKKGIVVKSIASQKNGAVQVNGQWWSAISCEKDTLIEKGSVVEVVDVQGVHLIVKSV